MSLPQIVDEQQWRESNAALIEKEKAATRAGDALAAERRRQPMMAFDTGFEFDGPSGRVSFLDLFEGRPQLVLYHFWFPEDGEPCGGCSMFTDQVTHLAHLHARGVSFALVSRASQERIAAYKERMGWDIPWYTDDLAFQEYCGTTEYFRFQVFLRDGDDALPHLRDHRARQRGDRDRVVIPRSHAVRAPGGVGGHPGRAATGPAVPVVAQARRVLELRAQEQRAAGRLRLDLEAEARVDADRARVLLVDVELDPLAASLSGAIDRRPG